MALDLDGEQRRIAKIIIETGLQMGFGMRDIKIGLMTAMQESGMRNLNYGHSDSLGVFQQRPSQGWGTPQQVTDPHYSARKFFSVLRGVDGRQQMPLWEAAQAVQRSAYPTAYRKHFGIASQTLKWYRANAGGPSGGAAFTAAPDPTFKDDPHRFDLTTTPEYGAKKKKSGGGVLKAARAPGMGASTEPLVLPSFSTRRDFNDAMQKQGLMPPGKTGNMSMDQIRRQIIKLAKKQIGVNYVWGGESPSGFDCSGFTQWVYGQFGIKLPRISYQQGQGGYKAFGGLRNDLGKLQAGDLVFWDNSSRNSGADHVAIYLGNGKIIEAPRPGRSVGISELYDMENAWGVHLSI